MHTNVGVVSPLVPSRTRWLQHASQRHLL